MAITQFPTREKILNINEIFKDESIYPREKMDEKRVELFISLMKAGTTFPNIKVVRESSGRYIILDGFHRYTSYKTLDQNEIKCDLIEADQKTWRLLSVRFNFDTSQPLKFGEIKKAITDAWIIDDMRDKQKIADILGCSVPWVFKVTQELDQKEDEEKLALVRKLQQEENASIREIADKVGWSKSTIHRKLNQQAEPDETETETIHATQTTIPADETESELDDDQPETTQPAFQNAEKIIENFDKFSHKWEPDQKETLYAFDGIRMGRSVETISEQSGKNPNWIRSTAYILLALHHEDERDSEYLFAISEKLSVNIERVSFINYLFTHWPSTLPERKDLFQWILNNQTQYRDDRISEMVRLEHLFWHSKNVDAEKIETDEEGDRLLRELPQETYSRLIEITKYFEDLKKYIRNYEIETALAKDLLERLNHIRIPQNRIQDHLHKFI
jgi:ParB-like chromosome segregation protein Spo0J